MGRMSEGTRQLGEAGICTRCLKNHTEFPYLRCEECRRKIQMKKTKRKPKTLFQMIDKARS